MHGLGNDFVVIDDRNGAIALGIKEARAIANRRSGVGFDQLLILEKPTTDTMAPTECGLRGCLARHACPVRQDLVYESKHA